MPESFLENERMPPASLDAEAAVIGSCLLDPRAIELVLDTLGEEDFYRNANRIVYRAVKEISLNEGNHPVDLVSVQDWLHNRQLLEIVGGPVALAAYTERVASAANVEAYARIVKEKSQVRKLLTVLQQATAEAYAKPHSPAEVLSYAEEMVMGVADPALGTGFEPMKSLVDEHLIEVNAAMTAKTKRSVETGIYAYDEYTGGLYPGQLVLLAARPGQGKTALALNMSCNLCEQNIPVAFLSLELTKNEVLERIICSKAELNSRTVSAGKINSEQFAHYKKWAEKIQGWPLRVCEESLDLTQLKSSIRSLVRRHKVRVVFLDYIQLLEVKEGEDMREKIALASKTLKQLAKKLHITIVACAQLNRGPAGTQGRAREPYISDLAETDALARDSDVIILIYPKDSEESMSYVLKRGKNRKGPTGKNNIRFNKDYTRFEHDSEPWRDEIK